MHKEICQNPLSRPMEARPGTYTTLLQELVRQLHISLCNSVHVNIANLLARLCPWILLRIWRRRGRRTVGTAPSARSGTWFQAHCRLSRQSCGRRHWYRLKRLIKVWSDSTNTVAESPWNSSVVSTGRKRGVRAAVGVCVRIPIRRAGVRRVAAGCVRIVRGWTSVICCWRRVSCSCLEAVCLRGRRLAGPHGLGRVRERLNSVWVQREVIEVGNLQRNISNRISS